MEQASASIDLDAIASNLALAQTLAPDCQVMAVIKADAYGHGAVQVAQHLQALPPRQRASMPGQQSSNSGQPGSNPGLQSTRQGQPGSRPGQQSSKSGQPEKSPSLHLSRPVQPDSFGLARLSEAVTLREAGVAGSICLLEGISNQQELHEAGYLNLDLVIHSPEQLQMMAAAQVANSQAEPYPGGVWLKVDTGMNRLGFKPEQLGEALIQCKPGNGKPGFRLLGLMSHLANADDVTDAKSQSQYQQIMQLSKQLRSVNAAAGRVSLANSAGIMGHQLPASWVRPGLMLYGASPFVHNTGTKAQAGVGSSQFSSDVEAQAGVGPGSYTDDADSRTGVGPGQDIAETHSLANDGQIANCDSLLVPAMTFTAPIIAIRQIRAGDQVGYGSTWVAPVDTRLAVVAVGYGDGYPREIAPGTQVLVGKNRRSIVGRVSMDMITVELQPQDQLAVNDRVTLWGDGLPVDEIAASAGTLAYTLLCGVNARVKREYTAR